MKSNIDTTKTNEILTERGKKIQEAKMLQSGIDLLMQNKTRLLFIHVTRVENTDERVAIQFYEFEPAMQTKIAYHSITFKQVHAEGKRFVEHAWEFYTLTDAQRHLLHVKKHSEWIALLAAEATELYNTLVVSCTDVAGNEQIAKQILTILYELQTKAPELYATFMSQVGYVRYDRGKLVLLLNQEKKLKNTEIFFSGDLLDAVKTNSYNQGHSDGYSSGLRFEGKRDEG